MKTILVVDDDTHIGNLLEEALAGEGYGVLRAYSGSEALLVLSNARPDLILLDLMLPGLSGEEVLPRLGDIPVIVVSAKVDVDDKVRALYGGAVDYMTKPFQIRELLARVAAHLRDRAGDRVEILRYGELSLDPETRAVKAGEGEVRLTRTEYAILKLLMRNEGRVISKSRLLDEMSVETPDCTESSLKTHISNLRRKLREADGEDHIEAVWGIGFKLR